LWRLNDEHAEIFIYLVEALRLETPRQCSDEEFCSLLVLDLEEVYVDLELYDDGKVFGGKLHDELRGLRGLLELVLGRLGQAGQAGQARRPTDWEILRASTRSAFAAEACYAVNLLYGLVIEAAAKEGSWREGCAPYELTALGALCDLDYLVRRLRGAAAGEASESSPLGWAADLLGQKVQALVGSWKAPKEREAGSQDQDITEEWPIPGRREAG
jgi:hypothetical protein